MPCVRLHLAACPEREVVIRTPSSLASGVLSCPGSVRGSLRGLRAGSEQADEWIPEQGKKHLELRDILYQVIDLALALPHTGLVGVDLLFHSVLSIEVQIFWMLILSLILKLGVQSGVIMPHGAEWVRPPKLGRPAYVVVRLAAQFFWPIYGGMMRDTV